MKVNDTVAAHAVLATLNAAREKICRGTAGLERLREALGRTALEDRDAERIFGLAEAALVQLYQGAAEMQAVRPEVMTVVDSCEILQGALRRQLRAASRDHADDPPFPESYL